jgi:hypothetical protein
MGLIPSALGYVVYHIFWQLDRAGLLDEDAEREQVEGIIRHTLKENLPALCLDYAAIQQQTPDTDAVRAGEQDAPLKP